MTKIDMRYSPALFFHWFVPSSLVIKKTLIVESMKKWMAWEFEVLCIASGPPMARPGGSLACALVPTQIPRLLSLSLGHHTLRPQSLSRGGHSQIEPVDRTSSDRNNNCQQWSAWQAKKTLCRTLKVLWTFSANIYLHWQWPILILPNLRLASEGIILRPIFQSFWPAPDILIFYFI